MLIHNPSFSCNPFTSIENGINSKRKRRPAGTPDPDAEVVSLSPKTLLESDRYVCEICNQGFQRDQNLQMHRRRHKVPWKLLKREDTAAAARKRVFVCPEPSCLHHDPRHALGDLVGIKKHFRRKHSNHKQWVCGKCCKAYAVQSDFKAHLKTCGTRGHSCDCGRVFSRVESFIEHQDACNMGHLLSEPHTLPPACLSRTASSPTPSSDTNISTAPPWPRPLMPKPTHTTTLFITPAGDTTNPSNNPPTPHHNLDLQLSTPPPPDEDHSTHLHLSIGSSDSSVGDHRRPNSEAARLKEEAREQLRLAVVEKGYAEEARREAKLQMEAAEQEFGNAKRMRQQAQDELGKARELKEHATNRISAAVLQITCHACKVKFQARATQEENLLALSYKPSICNNFSTPKSIT